MHINQLITSFYIMIVILCSLIGQARDLIFIGRCLYNDFNKLDKII